MIIGARNHKHDYVINNDRLMYKDQDGLSDSISYGFKTIFANLYEYELSRISESSLNRSIQMSLVIAEFSYAYLPKYFRGIIGVTGTYDEMSEFKKKYLQTDYKVN